ncbi:SsrA-binding protein SmpB [Demetria terragena]|uniref:SsrA-binding protein SmpB n=1 Tax=Demetria terragena TaxID=63959 RepID=UPI0003612519|nr:SsrA-binding protein SmpB [Demetria terragena]
MAKAKKPKEQDQRNRVIANNRKARHDYLIEDTVEAGLALMGTEVKSLRMGRATITEGWASEKNGELWLEGVNIPEYLNGSWTNHSARRRRKLLMHRHEMDKFIRKSEEAGHTLVPLSMYFKNGRVKVEIALAKGKREFDKRETLRRRTDDREAQRAIQVHLKRGR